MPTRPNTPLHLRRSYMSTNIKQLVLASSNTGKLREFQNLLGELSITVTPQSEFNVADADETGLSFVENAIIKARNACVHTQLPSVADDSGLEVDALDGAPGIYSARFGGEHGNDANNNAQLLSALSEVPTQQRQSRYQCVLVFMRHAKDPTPIICQGSWEGSIIEAPRGSEGFGYDPLFWAPEHRCSAAELPKKVKNSISHRAKAMQMLLAELRLRFGI